MLHSSKEAKNCYNCVYFSIKLPQTFNVELIRDFVRYRYKDVKFIGSWQ